MAFLSLNWSYSTFCRLCYIHTQLIKILVNFLLNSSDNSLLKSGSPITKEFVWFLSMLLNPLKMTKNAFYFILKSLTVFNIFKFLPLLFWSCTKTAKVNFNIYDVINWETNNYNTHIGQYLKREQESVNEIWPGNRILREKYFLQKLCLKRSRETSCRPLFCYASWKYIYIYINIYN